MRKIPLWMGWVVCWLLLGIACDDDAATEQQAPDVATVEDTAGDTPPCVSGGQWL